MSAGWQSKSLADVCEIKPPKGEAKRKLKETDLVSFVPMENLGIDQKFLGPKAERKLSQVSGSYTYFADGDVLLAKITPCFENGKLGIAKGLTNGIGFGSSEYIVFRPSGDLSNEYLYYFLLQEKFRAEGVKTMSGAVGHKRVSKEFIERCQIPLAPFAEQQRIVAILDEAFAGLATATANAEKNLKNVRALFESYLNSVYEHKGSDWADKKLSDLVDVTHGFAFDGKHFIDGEDDYPILLTPGNFTEVGSLDFNERNTKRFTGVVSPNFVLRAGDLVMVMTDLSSKMKILGKPAFVDRDGILHNQRIGRVVFRDGNLWPEYLYYFFRTADFIAGVKDTATGTMVKHTAPKRILSAVIGVPPTVDEQKSIAAALNDLSSEVEKLYALYRKKMLDLTILKQAILHKAFSGELTSPPSQAIQEAAE